MIVYPVFDHDEVSEDFLVGVFSTVEKAQTYLDDNQGACGGTLFIGNALGVDDMEGFNIAAVVAQALS